MNKKSETAISVSILVSIILSIALAKVYHKVTLYVLSIIFLIILLYLIAFKGAILDIFKKANIKKSTRLFFSIMVLLFYIGMLMGVYDSNWSQTVMFFGLLISNLFSFTIPIKKELKK